MKLNEELAEWVAELRGMWSGKIEAPLSHRKRFLYPFIGAFTYFFFLIILRLREIPIPKKDVVERRDIISQVISDQGTIFAVSFTLIMVSSLWVAWLVSWPERAYSPLRLYLAGLTFPILISLVLMKFFTIM